MTTLLYLHGVGDDGTRRDWWERLLAVSGADVTDVTVVAPDYADLLSVAGTAIRRSPEPPTTSGHPEPHDRRAYRAAQARRHAEMVAAGSDSHWPHRRRGFARVPGMIDAIGERIVIGMLYEEVGQYIDEVRRRRAVLHRVLDVIPPGPVVIIGHSLGALVALDVIRHLPEGTTVPLLVTAASALARRKLPEDLVHLNDEFPYHRVGGWVNVYNPADPVTRGLPIGLRFPQTIDVSVRAGFADHALATCLADAGVAEVLAAALTAPTPSPIPAVRELALPDALALAQLQLTGHMEQILAADPATTVEELTTFMMARRVVGERIALRGSPDHHDWDRDHSDALRHRVAEGDIPALLVRLCDPDPLAPLTVTVPARVIDDARRRVVADLGVPPAWLEVAQRSRAEAATVFRPLRRRRRADPDPLPADGDEEIAATITAAVRASLLPHAVGEVPPSKRFAAGVGDLRPACAELVARALTAHRVGTPGAGAPERTALSRLMVLLGEHRLRVSGQPGAHERLLAELRRRAETVASSLSWLARQGVGLRPV
ncbi:MAG: hypothetical protein U0R64_03985 [Candidatus Nanopelagicales bacterium]